MDQSQHHQRSSRTNSAASNSNRRLFVAFLAAGAVVYAIYSLVPQSSSAKFDALSAASDVEVVGDELPTTSVYIDAYTDTYTDSYTEESNEFNSGGAYASDQTGSSRHESSSKAHASGDVAVAESCGNSAYPCDIASSQAESSGDAIDKDGSFIAGRVLSSDGHGVADIDITALAVRTADGAVEPSGLSAQRYKTRSDALGYYRLTGMPSGEYTVRSVGREKLRGSRIAARTGVEYANLIMPTLMTRNLEGQVQSTDGSPLEGVAVLSGLLGQPSVMTDANGRFRLEFAVSPEINRLLLRFQRPGYREQSRRVSLPLSSVESSVARAIQPVLMEPVELWSAVGGRVLSSDGKSLAGIPIELRHMDSGRVLTTSSGHDGQFNFAAVETPADYRLRIAGSPLYRDAEQMVATSRTAAADTDDIEIVLLAYEYGSVEGRVVNQSGLPVPGFELVLRNTASMRPAAELATDDYGQFTVESVPAGELVIASASDPAVLIQGLSLQPGERLDVPLVVDWGAHEIRGTVVDLRSNPVPASRVLLQWSQQINGVTARATRRTTTDAQGQFAFSSLGHGPHALRVDAPGHSPVSIDHDLSRDGYSLTVQLN